MWNILRRSISARWLIKSFMVVILADLGDYNPDEHLHGYLADMRLVPNQTEEVENKIAELHRMHRCVEAREWISLRLSFIQHSQFMNV